MWIMLRNAAFEQNKKYSKELTNIEYNKEIVYNEDYIEEQEGYNRLINNVYKEIDNWHWYDAKLFTLYLEQDVSMRELSKMTNISIGSIFQTLKNCKERLRENVGDDWEDYLNKDFELI
jgi:DNA-directed RNA polymerase specialized sigma24 family protein